MLGANHIPDDDNTTLTTTNQSQLFVDSNQTYYNVTTTYHDVSRWNTSEHDLTRWNATTTTTTTSSQEFVCAFYNPDFIIYSSLGSFYIPCFVMIFLYGRIFKVRQYRKWVETLHITSEYRSAVYFISFYRCHIKSRMNCATAGTTLLP